MFIKKLRKGICLCINYRLFNIVGYEGQVARGDALGGRWKV
jgi:hypothetical protein